MSAPLADLHTRVAALATHFDGATRNAAAPSTLSALLEAVEAFIRKYVVLASPQSAALALWTAHTHAIAAADCTPYIQVTSVTAETGKTRLLETAEQLVARPWLTGRTSAAALVRKIDGEAPTLLLDESDATFNGEPEYAEALRGILNTGYRRSGRTTLCVGQGANLTVRSFSTFSPKAIAGIGKLPDTVASRAIRIELKRRTRDEPVAKFRERDAKAEAAPICQGLTAWARQAIDRLRARRPVMPAGLRDRAEDVWESLFAIADEAGGDWPERARRAAVKLVGAEQHDDVNLDLLHDIRAIFDADAPANGFIASKVLLERLVNLEGQPWSDWRQGKPMSARALADRVKLFGIIPVPVGKSRGYFRDRFEDAWARYPDPKASNCENTNENGLEPAFSKRQAGELLDGLKTQKTPTNTRPDDASTDQPPDRQETDDAGPPLRRSEDDDGDLV